MKAVVAAFNQAKALVGAFSVITNLRMELFEALVDTCHHEDASYSLIGGGQTQVVIVTHKLFIHVRCYVQGQGFIITLLHFVKLRQKER